MLVERGHVGNLGAIGDLTVRLVADQINRMPVLLFLAREQRSERLEVLARVDSAHRVVRRVDDNTCGLRRESGVDGIDIHLEVGLVRRNLDRRATGGLGPHSILGEVRGDHHDFIPRVGNRIDADGEASGGASGKIDLVGRSIDAETAADIVSHCLARAGSARGWRVAMERARRLLDELGDGLGHSIRCRNARVADGEVKHVLLTDFGLALKAVGEKLANLVGGGAELGCALVEHGGPF